MPNGGSLMEEMDTFKAKNHSPATKWLRTYSWTPHTLQCPSRPSSGTKPCSVSSWILNFPCQIKQSIVFPLQGHAVLSSQVHIQKLTRTQGSCNSQIYRETKPLSDLPIEPITSTCPVLSFKEATTGGLFKGLGCSKTTICLITDFPSL